MPVSTRGGGFPLHFTHSKLTVQLSLTIGIVSQSETARGRSYDVESQKTEGCKSRNPDLESYLHWVESRSAVTPERERQLARSVGRGSRDAADVLIDAHLRYVVGLARRYEHRDMELMDLIAEGTVGLIGAVRNYDEHGDGSFTPHVLHAARERIRAAVGA